MAREIDEAIADAMAEEEVEREQRKAIREQAAEDAKEDLKDFLKDHLIEKLEDDSNTVEIELEELVILRQKEADLKRLLSVILGEFELSYNNEYLRIADDQKIADAVRVLYPEAYEDLLKALVERAEFEKAAGLDEG